ncbi:hypothetical protein [Kiritimatiella glycovorans]|uniref:Neutral/alkaline non-lysosomal ceramidase n=1 Tax=Kiritimatiella glycovorans TaxID=1307763 RepID=A0A0G3EBI4_9BACT|nr:hypothetical protein [Kiritimatiella glycovorans]AKJ63668.1 Neutral/alkaline non-lysosomal ceramidase [Kiritimatiella glycovorans]
MQNQSATRAGAAEADISPHHPQFLFGYPHVERMSTGIHDPLLGSALYLERGGTRVILIAADLIFVPRPVVLAARRRIFEATGVPESHILISASHTHSGPVTVDHASNADDPVVPAADPEYLALLENGLVNAGVDAVHAADEAEIAEVVADSTGIGTNRRDPDGPAFHRVPVIAARRVSDRTMIGLLMVGSMHPTVLHEDSTLVSADFPAYTRFALKERHGPVPVVYHTGPCGNLSPRHVTRDNTFAEAERLGRQLGEAVDRALRDTRYAPIEHLEVRSGAVKPVPRTFPLKGEAEAALRRAEERYETLRRSGAPRQEVRTAEVDLFGARETMTLSRLEAEGVLESFRSERTPAEIQVLRIGGFHFAGWPAEVFVEYGIELQRRLPGTYIISVANGELQGYLVTPEAAAQGGYEASNALFAHTTGERMLDETLRLLTADNRGARA